ncbi:MAG TPA: FxSxx-COOH system tetratricopeptide repeat protein, partial [Rugosimonospora sp.]|nr:FxSxx-COOH system tetratricopeptide repeat protein [Rugosimonospora sp.]
LRGWPAVAALAGARAIGQALKPLKITVPSAHDRVPDEEATAERAAEDGLWLPVFQPERERRWDVVVVVDDNPTMVVWQQTVGEFVDVLQRLGAFRNVQVRLLSARTRDPAAITVRGTGRTALAGAPSELLDPTGRRIVLVLTDGSAAGWWSGAALSAARAWAQALPVALVHLLPQQLWHQSGLHPRRVRMRSPAPGTATARTRWAIREPCPALLGGDRAATAIPVLELGARWLAPWARLVAGTGAGWLNLTAALVPAGGGPLEETEPSIVDAEATPRQLVSQFRAACTPLAFSLATHLAAAPLNVPVARMVQAVLLPRSQTYHLSEVFTSGLLRVSGAADPFELSTSDQVTVDFEPGVREELLSFARREDTVRVVRAVDEYLGPVVSAVRGIVHALDDPQRVPDAPVTAETEPFVRVEQAVLQALSGPYLATSRRLQAVLDQEADETTARTQSTEGVMATIPAQPQEIPEMAVPTAPVPAHPAGGAPSHSEIGVVRPVHRSRSAQTAPTVWGNVPPRNPNFTGRGELLESLHERLSAGTTAVLPEALHGMGGVGKSQLAVEYVYRHQVDYDLIWWIPAERPAQIGQALGELAQRLSLQSSVEVSSAVAAVKEALRVGSPFGNWLLVFDNAESPEDVRRFFPTGGPGCILVTSRDPHWASIARTLEVNVFTRSESKQLLRRRGPELSDHDADRLALALGDLPLAIEQAAAWRAETGMPAEEYLRLLEEKRPELLDDSPPPDYPTTVAAAWNVSLDALRVRNPGALRLLQLCAFLAPEPVSRTLFTGARVAAIHEELDTTLRDPIQFSRAVREINRYALARIDHRTNSIQMHRLVQRVLIGQMSDEERETMEHGAHLLLAASDPNDPDTTAHWPRYGELYSHVITSGAIKCRDPWVRQLVLNEAKCLWRWGESESSRDIAQRAYDVWRRQLGEEDPETLKIARWLGFMRFAVGSYEEAAALNTATLAIYQRTLGDDHEDTLEAMQAVAADRRVQGAFSAALELSDVVYQRSARTFGADDPITLNAAHNLGVSLRLASEFNRARTLDTDTSQRRIQILGEDHPDSLYTRLGLIIDQRELGDYAGACQALEELVARHRMLFGEDNFFTLRAVRTLSVTRRKAGDHAGALACAQEAWEALSKQYGEDNPETMAAALDLSTDRRQNGELRLARELGSTVLDRYRSTFGPDHPHTIGAAVNLATTDRLQGNLEGAYEVDVASYDALQGSLGTDHVLTLSSAINLGSDIYARGEVQRAHTHDAEVLERLRARLGPDHPITLACAVNLAIDTRMLGRHDAARAMHIATLEVFDRVLQPDHPATREAARWMRANCDMYPMPL